MLRDLTFGFSDLVYGPPSRKSKDETRSDDFDSVTSAPGIGEAIIIKRPSKERDSNERSNDDSTRAGGAGGPFPNLNGFRDDSKNDSKNSSSGGSPGKPGIFGTMFRGGEVGPSLSKSSGWSDLRGHTGVLRCFRPKRRARGKKTKYYWSIRNDDVWCDICQATWFDNLALFVIVSNAVWIGVDVGNIFFLL